MDLNGVTPVWSSESEEQDCDSQQSKHHDGRMHHVRLNGLRKEEKLNGMLNGLSHPLNESHTTRENASSSAQEKCSIANHKETSSVPSLLFVPDNNDNAGDDMENYFNENASNHISNGEHKDFEKNSSYSLTTINLNNERKTCCSYLKSSSFEDLGGINYAKCSLVTEKNEGMVDNQQFRRQSCPSPTLENSIEQSDGWSEKCNSCIIYENFSNTLTTNQVTNKSDHLSPDMDFLDFDFDPVPSGDEAQGQESDNSSSFSNSPRHSFLFPTSSNDLDGPSEPIQNQFVHSLSFQNLISSPKYQNTCMCPFQRGDSDCQNLEEGYSENTDSDSANLEACGERLLCRESSLFNIPNDAIENEESESHSDDTNLKNVGVKEATVCDESINECTNVSKDKVEDPIIEKVMLWSELEACSRQVTQIGTSACGATAVLNVLLALDLPADQTKTTKHIHTRLRAETSPVATYLLSRSVAGTTHEDLIAGIEKITDGAVNGRFFHFYPPRNVHLLKWLGNWIKKGVIPVVTLNLQRSVSSNQSIPDCWHHQMVFGIGPKGVYLTNPLECIPLKQISEQICSESLLLIRRSDILARWGEGCCLGSLMMQENREWRDLNVVGQVVNIVREASAPWVPGYHRVLTSHIVIPASYKSGVTLFTRTDSDAWQELKSHPELPLKIT